MLQDHQIHCEEPAGLWMRGSLTSKTHTCTPYWCGSRWWINICQGAHPPLCVIWGCRSMRGQHLSILVQQCSKTQITLFWRSPEIENKRYQKLHKESELLFFPFHSNAMSFTETRWHLAGSYPQKCVIWLFQSVSISPRKHELWLCLFWLCSTGPPHSSCVWFGSRKVSAIAKVPYGKASRPAFRVLSSLSILFTLLLFPLARPGQRRSELAAKSRRDGKKFAFPSVVDECESRRLRWHLTAAS